MFDYILNDPLALQTPQCEAHIVDKDLTQNVKKVITAASETVHNDLGAIVMSTQVEEILSNVA